MANFVSSIIHRIKQSIATRLSISLVAIITLNGLLFTIVGVQTISSLILSEAEDRVRNDLNTARLIYQERLNHIVRAVEFSATRTFIEDIYLPESERLAYLNDLSQFRINESLDFLSFTDSNGVVVLRTRNPTISGDDQRHQILVQAVLEDREVHSGTVIIPAYELALESEFLAGQAHFTFIDTPMARSRPETEETSGMVMMAAAPVFRGTGEFLGVVYAGILLNRNYEIVDEVKQTVFQGVVYNQMDIGTATIFQDDVRISTNVSNEDGTRAIGTRVSEEVYRQVVTDGAQLVGPAYVVNDWYISAYGPISDPQGKIIGIVYVGILQQKYADIKSQAILIFSGITFLGVILSIGMTLLISRGISLSIQRLATASKQVAKGNLDAKVIRYSNDELGDLGDTFNFMANALKERDEKIKKFTKEKIMESERLALVGQLSANVAHELNNPLQGIVTYSYLLLEDTSCTEDAKINLQKIVIQANRCRDIIRGLLDFSRHKNPDKTLCNVNTLLQGCISLVEKQAQFHNIRIVLNLDANLPSVILDPSQIERVFLNLIINSADAMNGNGKLIITTKQNRKKESIEIKVQDTGHGISPENMNKIFDPFFTTKETGHGVGLGLAISYGIVSEHEGSIVVESELGKGTTFTVNLPVNRKAVQ